jgi:hypothetical protein
MLQFTGGGGGGGGDFIFKITQGELYPVQGERGGKVTHILHLISLIAIVKFEKFLRFLNFFHSSSLIRDVNCMYIHSIEKYTIR